MKKYICLLLILPFLFGSCDSFLDSNNYTKKDTSNFPETIDDAEQTLTAIYSTMSQAVSNPQHTLFYMAELASDDRFGGGGENDKDMQGLDHLMNTRPSRFEPFWTARYQGIFRANMALETLDNCTGWVSVDQRNQFFGEAYFMRAMFYFELAQMFGEVPLVLETAAKNLPKAPADDLYAQIASDLSQAIELMYDEPYTKTVSGHATKWAAQALMGRVFLFYTGYYGKTELPLPDGTSIGKSQVITWLEDCINNSGHDLIDDFRNLWPYTNSYTVEEYSYTAGKNLRWAGDGHKESVFAVKFGTSVDWNNDFQLGYSNQYILHFGLRTNNGGENTFPFGQGWGAGPVNPNLWSQWRMSEPADIRRQASILDVDSEIPAYIYGADKQMEETGYWQKKYMPIMVHDPKNGDLLPSYGILMYDGPKDYQLAHLQDLILIRFADVLLMHSELKQDATGLTRVRTRAGLPAVAYSLDAIKRERRWELSFEGLRYFDIMRWGDAADLLASQEGVSIKNRGTDTVMRAFGGGYRTRFEATGGFWPIPESQISLSNGVLTQNKGWGTAAAEFPGW